MPDQDHRLDADRVTPSLIVESKLRIPPSPEPTVLRSRLMDLVERDGMPRRVYVTGPAGIGKSTFLSQWCRERQLDSIVIWLSLDELDADSARLWSHIFEAAELASPNLGVEAGNAARSGSPLFETVLPLFLNDLDLCDTPVVIAFDDVHCIGKGPAADSLATLAEQLPHGTILAMASRHGLGPRENRWVMHGQAVRVSSTDLRFNMTETGSLIEQMADVPLTPAMIDDATAATGGWAVPLRLVAAHYRTHAGETLPPLTGEPLMDYLSSEVLDALTPDELDATAFLAHIKRFNRHLLAEVAPDSLLLLASEMREQLGIVDLGSGWFTLHQLVREALLRRAASHIDPAQLVATAKWHAANHLIEDAIAYAIAADAWDLAADLLNESWLSYVSAGRAEALADLVDLVSNTAVGADDRVIVTAAWLAGWRHDLVERDRLLDIIDARTSGGQLPDGCASIHHAAALNRAFLPGDYQSLTANARIAREMTSDDSPWMSFALMGEGTERMAEGDFRGCRRAYLAAADLSEPLLQAATVGGASLAAVLEGDLTTATDLAERAAFIREESRLGHVEWLVFHEITLGYLALHRSSPVEAELHFATALEGVQHLIEPYPEMSTLIGLAEAHHLNGDRASAAEALRRAQERAAKVGDIGDYFESLLSDAKEAFAPERPLAHAMAFEPLTDREQTVLVLLATTRLSQSEIARDLYVSHNTVKTHTKSIYRKLHVISRGRAAERASNLGLI